MPLNQKLDNTITRVRSEFDRFSRTTRTLVVVAGVSIILLGVLESMAIAKNLNAEADDLLLQIDRARSAQAQLKPAFRDQVQAMGELRLPDPRLSTLAAVDRMYEVINEILIEILGANNAEMAAISISPGANLPNSAAPEIPRSSGQKLAKIVGRIEFDCNHASATRIIKALESSPEIYSITRLQLSRYDSGPEQSRGLVNVDVTLESWVLKMRSNRRGV